MRMPSSISPTNQHAVYAVVGGIVGEAGEENITHVKRKCYINTRSPSDSRAKLNLKINTIHKVMDPT